MTRGRRNKPPKLDDQDPKPVRGAEAWTHFAKSITPLDNRPPPPTLPGRGATVKQIVARLDPARGQKTDPLPVKKTPDSRLPGKLVRQIRSGRYPIDRTLDLHGLTQDAAYQQLVSAIHQAGRQGQRLLLVVTGKGGARFAQGDPVSPGDRPRSAWQPEGGVLRRMLPLWLADPTLASFVIAHQEAGKQDGGAGARYVWLRKTP